MKLFFATLVSALVGAHASSLPDLDWNTLESLHHTLLSPEASQEIHSMIQKCVNDDAQVGEFTIGISVDNSGQGKLHRGEQPTRVHLDEFLHHHDDFQLRAVKEPLMFKAFVSGICAEALLDKIVAIEKHNMEMFSDFSFAYPPSGDIRSPDDPNPLQGCYPPRCYFMYLSRPKVDAKKMHEDLMKNPTMMDDIIAMSE